MVTTNIYYTRTDELCVYVCHLIAQLIAAIIEMNGHGMSYNDDVKLYLRKKYIAKKGNRLNF